LFQTKPVDVIVAQHTEAGGHGLRRSMGLLQLTALSVGATSRGPVARRMLGTVTTRLVERSRRPVLVVTPPLAP